jgi:hypothetical protein
LTRKSWGVLAGAVVLVGGTAIGLVAATANAKPMSAAAQQPPTNTAKVVEGKLSATVSQAGTLTYQAQPDGSPYTVITQTQGTYTALPTPGQVITQGQVLYQVDGRPVTLLYGPMPAYRTLGAGATGADVAELNADLVALGDASTAQLSPASDSFGPATTTALEELQASLGVPQNGRLALGDAVFEPNALRVTSLSAQLGSSSQPGQTVMAATATNRLVQVALDASQQTEVAAGNPVTITLPDNRTTPGVVSSVGAVASCPPTPGSGGSSSPSAASGTDACSSANGTSSAPTITVDVTPSDPAAVVPWDQAPVQVGITTSSVPRALAVPVTALLARSSGGYAVEVVDPGGTNHLVMVSLGLFDDAQGLVQVTGSGLAAGQKVGIPST